MVYTETRVKKFIIQAVLLITILFASLFFATRPGSLPFLPQTSKVSQAIIGDISLNVEIADTSSKRSKGLANRERLASNSGMLFIFDKESKYSFWMKGLKFPLDLIWIKNRQVVDLIKNVLPPEVGQKDETLPIYVPNQPVDMVLEVNGGFIDSNNIKIGDTITIK